MKISIDFFKYQQIYKPGSETQGKAQFQNASQGASSLSPSSQMSSH